MDLQQLGMTSVIGLSRGSKSSRPRIGQGAQRLNDAVNQLGNEQPSKGRKVVNTWPPKIVNTYLAQIPR